MTLIIENNSSDWRESINYIPIYYKNKYSSLNIHNIKFGGLTIQFFKNYLNKYIKLVNESIKEREIAIKKWQEVVAGTNWE